MCAKYGKLLGVHLHPHAFRHTMANKFLQDTSNDLVSLAQILGHESLQTTRRYAQRSEQQLADVAEKLNY
ncbi:MAG: tyrosine-type recombinase/integrase [candidate division KSB1 bacterium]|nr:tyrosine-type recombinase/integrase [candidate division KSB1 bacterium]